MLGRGILLGTIAATGALLLVPGVAVAVARAGKPVARAATKTGATAIGESRRAGAEVYENLEDIAAEIRSDMAEAAGADLAEAAGAEPAEAMAEAAGAVAEAVKPGSARRKKGS